jgi:hypothetical protein
MTTESNSEKEKEAEDEKKPIDSLGIAVSVPIDTKITKEELPEIPQIKEQAAKWIAMLLVGGFLIMMGLPYLYLTVGTVSEVIDLIKTISATMSGIVGAVIGYYFRVEQSRAVE